jgi:hypothetical protein
MCFARRILAPTISFKGSCSMSVLRRITKHHYSTDRLGMRNDFLPRLKVANVANLIRWTIWIHDKMVASYARDSERAERNLCPLCFIGISCISLFYAC